MGRARCAAGCPTSRVSSSQIPTLMVACMFAYNANAGYGGGCVVCHRIGKEVLVNRGQRKAQGMRTDTKVVGVVTDQSQSWSCGLVDLDEVMDITPLILYILLVLVFASHHLLSPQIFTSSYLPLLWRKTVKMMSLTRTLAPRALRGTLHSKLATASTNSTSS